MRRAQKNRPGGRFLLRTRLEPGKTRFLVQTGAGKTADIPLLSLRELFQSLWDKHCSRSDKYCLRSKREGLIR